MSSPLQLTTTSAGESIPLCIHLYLVQTVFCTKAPWSCYNHLHSDEENHCNYDRDHSHKGLGYPKEFDLWVYCTASVPTTMQHLHFDFEYFPRHGLGRTQGDWPLVQDE